jgi:hypothetical protein
MAKRDLLKLPNDLDANMRALLATPPAPHGTAGSRKAPPKPPAKAKRKRPKLTHVLPKQATLDAQARYRREKLVEKLTKPQKRKEKEGKKR